MKTLLRHLVSSKLFNPRGEGKEKEMAIINFSNHLPTDGRTFIKNNLEAGCEWETYYNTSLNAG